MDASPFYGSFGLQILRISENELISRSQYLIKLYMTRIKTFKSNRGLAIFLNVVGGLLVLAAIIMFVKERFLHTAPDIRPLTYILLFLQGVFLIVLASSNIRYGKYYIEWDGKTLKYYLPHNKNAEIIEISDITNITIGLFEIQIEVGDDLKILNLEHVDFEEIKSIKSKFDEIRDNLKS